MSFNKYLMRNFFEAVGAILIGIGVMLIHLTIWGVCILLALRLGGCALSIF